MPINATQKPIYESFVMQHPNGDFMCHINEKRANWYVQHGLADWVEEKTFKLKFEPKGYGKKDLLFYNQKLENRCVVCGDTSNNLNKHHVVPYVFRSRFPIEYKESNHHDILVTCIDCHEKYEGVANKYKKKLAEDIGASMTQAMTQEQKYNKKILSARNVLSQVESGELTDINGNSLIPVDKMTALKEMASLELLEDPTIEEGPVWADKIMEKVINEDSLFEFVKKWRSHFIEHAKPQFLPDHWSVDHLLEKSK